MKRLTTTDGIVSLLRDYDIRVILSNLYGYSKGTVTKYGNSYLVVLEESLCFDCLLESLKHELCHILLGHLDDDTKTDEEKEDEVIYIMKGVNHDLS